MFTDKNPTQFVISHTLKNFTLQGPTMGTRYSANFFAPSNIDLNKVSQALQRVVDDVDNQMSPWKSQSDLTRFNNAHEGQWINIPIEMAVVMNEALRIGKLTGGAFNIGVGEITNNWGFGSAHAISDNLETTPNATMASAHDILELEMDQFRLRKHAPITLDLCGIAKGFGVDELARVLLNYGIEDFLVSIDGEIKASGYKGACNPWIIGIEKPDYNHRDTLMSIEVCDISIATSGDYRHFRQVGDNNVSHTIDASTGSQVRNNIASVTVATECCMSADAWATAFLVLGKEKAIELANKVQVDALIFERHSKGFHKHAAGSFTGLIS